MNIKCVTYFYFLARFSYVSLFNSQHALCGVCSQLMFLRLEEFRLFSAGMRRFGPISMF